MRSPSAWPASPASPARRTPPPSTPAGTCWNSAATAKTPYCGSPRHPRVAHEQHQRVRTPPDKTQQKISGRLTSEETTQDRLDIRSYIDTARKHGQDILTCCAACSPAAPGSRPRRQPSPHKPAINPSRRISPCADWGECLLSRAAPLRGTAAALPAPRSALRAPLARARRHARRLPQIRQAHLSRRPMLAWAVFLAPDCPARGHRINGGPEGRRTRSAAPTIDLFMTYPTWTRRSIQPPCSSEMAAPRLVLTEILIYPPTRQYLRHCTAGSEGLPS